MRRNPNLGDHCGTTVQSKERQGGKFLEQAGRVVFLMRALESSSMLDDGGGRRKSDILASYSQSL